MPKAPSQVPHVPRGQCGAPMASTNLVSGGCAACHVHKGVPSAAACAQLCAADGACNFYTWHTPQVQPASYARECYLREDATYARKAEGEHTSGVCNHTLPGPGATGGGVHGLSVGARLIDFGA